MTQPRRPGSHVHRNRAAWNADADDYQARHGIRHRLAAGDPGWGCWNVPESELRVLGEVAGRDVWSSAAARPSGPSSWPGPAPGWWASTCPSVSSGMPAG